MKTAVFTCKNCRSERRARIREMIHSSIAKALFVIEKTQCSNTSCWYKPDYLTADEIIRVE